MAITRIIGRLVRPGVFVVAAVGLTMTALAATPVITSPSTASGTKGIPFSYQITATNNPTSYNSALGVPSVGVTFATGLIQGTPSSEGTFTTTISATNADGTGSATLVITIGPPLPTQPVITSLPYALAVIGRPFSYQITATNNPTSFDTADYGNGLSLNPSTGVLSGVPTKDSGLVYASMRATNAIGTGYRGLLVVFAPETTVLPTITGPTEANATVGEPFNLGLSREGDPVLFDAAGLPPGLEMAYNLGSLYGTPTAAGTYTVNLLALNAAGTSHATMLLTVAPAGPQTPVITSPLTATATIGVPFSYQITASNHPTRFGAEGAVPGLSVAFFTGVLSGTFEDVGIHTLDLSATNTAGTGQATLTLKVVSPNNYTAWATARGLAGADAAQTADPDADGLPNLLEFALHTDPHQPSAGQTPSFTYEPSQDFCTLQHRRAKVANLIWRYEVSPNLTDWAPITYTMIVVDNPDDDGDGTTELVRAVVLVDAGEPRKFIRVVVSEP